MQILNLRITTNFEINFIANGETVLNSAAYNGFFEGVKCLIDNGADITTKDNYLIE